MPTNIHPVSFFNPLDPGGAAALQVQQQQIQRQQAIAQALQQQSMQEDQVAPGSRVSWTQGAAKLAEALAARSAFKKTDAQQVDLATKQGQMMARMFGLNQPSQAAPSAATAPASSPVTPTDNVSNTPPSDPTMRGSYGSGGVEDNGSLPVAPQAPPQAAPQAAPPPEQAPMQAAPQPQQRGPMSLSGNPMQDYVDYTANQGEYTKALIASHAPTDLSKMMQQAGIDPNTDLGRQILQANIAKQNYVAPMNVRQGGMVYNPVTKQIELQTAQAPPGSAVDYQDGKPVGVHTIPGATGAIQSAKAAEATGTAAGELAQVWDPVAKQMVNVPKSVLLQSAANGQPSSAAGPPLGAQAAANVTGTNSANAFQDISNGAADVPNRIYALHQMQGIANDPNAQFGAGSNGLNHFNSLLGTISHSTGINFDPKAATNANEFQKWATQYSARSGQELGLSGSDARTQLAVHATPNGEMTRPALQSVIPQMIGIENAKQGYAQAANVWQQAHGPQDVQNFRTEWNKVYNPAIYTHMALGPQAFAGWVKALNPQQAAQVRQQYLQLKNLGALPQ